MSASRSFLSSRALLVAVSAVSLVVLISLTAFFFVDARAESLLSEREATIAEEDLKLLEIVDQEEGGAGVIRSVARRAALPSDQLGIVALVDRTGKALAGNIAWPRGLQADRQWRPVSAMSRTGETISGFARAVVMPDGTRLLVGRNYSASRRFRASLSEAMVAALSALLVASLSVGIGLNRYVLSRIDTITRTANHISRNNLAERIPVSAAQTEFDRLAVALNGMLDRNEAHVSQMQSMTDAIAHDLRLPLQRMKLGLRSASDIGDPSRQREAIDGAIADADDALRTFNALLAMARAEAGVGKETFEMVDLSRLVGDVVELFEPLADEKGQTLEMSISPIFVRGQGMLLKQAVGNLVQNAIKYTPTGGKIVIRLTEAGGNILAIVEDNGLGIPEADRSKALQPYGRLTRDRDAEGSGLGLALAAAFAKLHDGTLHLDNANPGLRATLTLPRVKDGGPLNTQLNQN